MEIIIFFVIIFIGYVCIEIFKDSPKQERKIISQSAQEIADKVKTPKQLQALEQRRDRAFSRSVNVQTDKAIQNAEKKFNILDEAVYIAESKVLYYQFIPEIDLTTPKRVLDHAYKCFSPEEYEEKKSQISENPHEWHKNDLIDGAEKLSPDPFVNSQKKLREIFEGELSKGEKIIKINQLAARSKALRNAFFSS